MPRLNPLSFSLHLQFSPALAGADTTPPLRLAPAALASPPLTIAPRAAAAAPPPSPTLAQAAPLPTLRTVADLLDSPVSALDDSGEPLVGGGRAFQAGAASASASAASPAAVSSSTASTIPAHWPTKAAREAAGRAYGLAAWPAAATAGGGGGGAAAASSRPSFPPKAVVTAAPSPEGAADHAAVAALQAEVRRTLAGVGMAVPLSSARRGGGGGGGGSAQQQQQQESATAAAHTPGRRLTALEAVLGGLGLGTPRGRRGGGA
jgi:hypothetical protein